MNEGKKDYFNPGFENFGVLVLDPMHMQCGLKSDREAWATENPGLDIISLKSWA
jgi:hypothetical protein